MQVNILDAKNQLSELLKKAQRGEEIIIANRGQPVARLVPVSSNAPAGGKRNFLAWLDAHPLPPHRTATAAEIDAAIEAERAAWD
ncbi:MAG: type II toxin-antitoxin system prevent-host-death family antitoxin [Gammaproteobacteria bacterium]|nr:type II toxin-antitoxin system prevent-host-death family antitoxin [Gammaproteobacteria bacterium]